MIDCLILGDSIATGMAQYAPFCHHAAKSGISTQGFAKTFGNSLRPARKVIISLGTNDAVKNSLTYQNAVLLRQTIAAETVVWILPSAALRPNAQNEIHNVASAYQDYVVSIPQSYLAGDGIHLSGKGYKTLINWLLLHR